MSFVMPSGNRIDWSAICNCIYVGYKGNKYSYVTFDIMLIPNPTLQKVLWKIFWLIVHSIVGTLGSSFLARNGGARRWLHFDRMVLIMLIVSLGDWLVLFFLHLFFFFLVTIVVSAGRYAFYGWVGEYSIRSLNENFLSLIVKQILAVSA
jgi:hypothetical protein